MGRQSGSEKKGKEQGAKNGSRRGKEGLGGDPHDKA